MTTVTGFSPAGDGNFYNISSEDYVRVTRLTDLISGQHLLSWYAKQAALKSASWLVQGGIFANDHIDEELYEFTEEQAYRVIEAGDALRNALDWQSNMKEAERFRDERARVGKLGHLWNYHFAMGTAPGNEQLMDWLTSQAMAGSFLPTDMVNRFEGYGIGREKIAFDHAKQALDCVYPLQKWFDDYKPEYHAVGMEAVVFDEDEKIAGTCDGWARFERRHWGRHREWLWPGRDWVDLLIDLKFTKSMPQMVLAQMCFYRACPWLLLTQTLEVVSPPPCDGVACLHVRPNRPVNFKAWADNEALDACYEQVCLSLVDVWRFMEEKVKPARAKRPRATRAIKKTEARKVPF